MKDDVVRLQQEQVTIMTQGQWNFNVIKQWMTATNDAMGFEARGSSVYSSINQFGPTFVTDGEVSSKTTCSFTPTLGTRGFSRVRREFSVLAEGRHIFGRRPKPRAAKPREKPLARSGAFYRSR